MARKRNEPSAYGPNWAKYKVWFVPFSLTPAESSPKLTPTVGSPLETRERLDPHSWPISRGVQTDKRRNREFGNDSSIAKEPAFSRPVRIELIGKLMMGNDSRQVEWSVAELLVAGVKKVVFDLSRLDGIDSTGVGIIVVCHAKLQKVGGNLRLAGATGIVLETLQMTHVDKIVSIFPNAEEAGHNFAVAESA